MNRNKVLEIIKNNHGIYFNQRQNLLTEDEQAELSEPLKTLITDGAVTFILNKYYPNYRSIGLVPKGQKETSEIIDLQHEIPINELRRLIPPKSDDPTYCDGYLITEETRHLFERTNHFEFDFENNEYYLFSTFDNTNDINPK
jgi:hypothetical protein